MHYVFGMSGPFIDRIAAHLKSGSWYRGHEIARRGGIFYTGLAAGTLTAGLIQAGASTSLEGVRGETTFKKLRTA